MIMSRISAILFPTSVRLAFIDITN
jgi:hypothetical protein